MFNFLIGYDVDEREAGEEKRDIGNILQLNDDS